MKERIEEVIDYAIHWFRDNKKNAGKLIAIALILVTALGLRLFGNSSVHADDVDTQTDIIAYVDISGEVKNPGIYEVDVDTRLFEVIEMAGGLSSDADLDSINQADYVEDGQKIIIPAKQAEVQVDSESNNNTGSSGTSTSYNSKININTASRDELKQLTGVGDVIADRIIEYRESNRFKSVDELKNVKGIGDSIFDKNKDRITV